MAGSVSAGGLRREAPSAGAYGVELLFRANRKLPVDPGPRTRARAQDPPRVEVHEGRDGTKRRSRPDDGRLQGSDPRRVERLGAVDYRQHQEGQAGDDRRATDGGADAVPGAAVGEARGETVARRGLLRPSSRSARRLAAPGVASGPGAEAAGGPHAGRIYAPGVDEHESPGRARPGCGIGGVVTQPGLAAGVGDPGRGALRRARRGSGWRVGGQSGGAGKGRGASCRLRGVEQAPGRGAQGRGRQGAAEDAAVPGGALLPSAFALAPPDVDVVVGVRLLGERPEGADLLRGARRRGADGGDPDHDGKRGRGGDSTLVTVRRPTS